MTETRNHKLRYWIQSHLPHIEQVGPFCCCTWGGHTLHLHVRRWVWPE